MRILIVDDEESARIMLGDILQLEGYEIRTAASGEEAVGELRQQQYDLMIVDLWMEGMSGMEVLRTIAAERPSMPVIILTAYGTLDTATQAIRYHVQDYLLKPISPAQILESVRRVVSEAEGIANSPITQAATSSAADRISTLPGGATLAWDTRVLSWPGGRISLTPTEGHLLKILFDHRNEMVSHPALVFQIQGYHVDNEEAAKILRPVVSRLRRKLAVVPNWNNRIKTVRGDGYVLEWMSQPVR